MYSNLTEAFMDPTNPNSYINNIINYNDMHVLPEEMEEIKETKKENFESQINYNNGQLVKNSISESFNCNCNCKRNTVLLYFLIFLILFFKFT